MKYLSHQLGVPITLYVFVYDQTDADAIGITGLVESKFKKRGYRVDDTGLLVSFIPSGTITEVDAVNAKGVYKLTLTGGEITTFQTVVGFTIDESEGGQANYRSDPLGGFVLHSYTSLADIQGGSFATATDSLRELRKAMTDSATAIVRSA